MLQDEICRAIQAKKIITLSYDRKTRTVLPHMLAFDADGDLTLYAWQLQTGSGEGWRQFHVSNISGMSITGQSFLGPRIDWKPHKIAVSRVLCRL
jgi:predicted DNA-binding transcriptional regulator YafY